jgi:Zn-dependent protease
VSLETFLYLAPLLLASLVLHELAHALAATRLGDPTPREQGRLTLNPIPHLDPLGTTMFVLTAFVSNFIFGWARPVLVQPRYFRRPQLGMALVAAAGPATNFLLALACAAYLVHGDATGRTFEVAVRAYEVNIVLGIFNLIPIPPLDGSRILGAILPAGLYARWSSLDQVGMLALFGLIFVFNDQFWEVFGEVLDRSTRVMVSMVGG